MPQNQRFTDFLKKGRLALGVSQSSLAASSGISVDTIRAWEQGRYEPDLDALRGLFAALGPHAEPIIALLGLERAAPASSEAYYKLREDLEVIIDSGQSQLINQAEEILDRLAENASHMTRKSKHEKPRRVVQRHVPITAGSQKHEN